MTEPIERAPDVRVQWLEAFLATDKFGSMTDAAKALDVSQSTVSRDLGKLEDALGRLLTTRDVPFALTPEGLAFQPIAQKMIDELEAFKATGFGF